MPAGSDRSTNTSLFIDGNILPLSVGYLLPPNRLSHDVLDCLGGGHINPGQPQQPRPSMLWWFQQQGWHTCCSSWHKGCKLILKSHMMSEVYYNLSFGFLLFKDCICSNFPRFTGTQKTCLPFQWWIECPEKLPSLTNGWFISAFCLIEVKFIQHKMSHLNVNDSVNGIKARLSVIWLHWTGWIKWTTSRVCSGLIKASQHWCLVRSQDCTTTASI